MLAMAATPSTWRTPFGGSISGGPGKDGVVFAGSSHGVEASLKKGGNAKWQTAVAATTRSA